MTIYISPFLMGVICTLGAEIVALIVLAIIYNIRNSRKTRGNTSSLNREDENE